MMRHLSPHLVRTSSCLALALLWACEGSQTNAPDGEGPATRPVQGEGGATPSPTAAPTPAGARSVSEETDDFVFNYSYPAEAGNIAELAQLLDARLDRARERIAREAARGKSEARENGFPFNKYSSGMEWQVVADLPGWLSLSGSQRSYTGGAHGIYGLQSMLWDKRNGEALPGIELFSSAQELSDSLGERYCDALNGLRAERLSQPVDENTVFGDCPALEDLSVLLGSSDGERFDRLTLYAGPYVAGSYAEGAYSVNLDVDQAILGAVKPEFRESFNARN